MDTDEQLVAKWQTSRDTAALAELRRRTRPLVQSQVNKFRSNSVPSVVLETKADQILVESADKFRPAAGARFRTFLFGNLRRLNRFSAARSNIATIPEARTQNIGVYQRVYDGLQAQKMRPPTTAELADELSWSQKEVRTMQRSLRRDIVSSSMSAPARLDTTEARTSGIMQDIWYELTPDEQRVYGHIIGRPGFRKTSKGQEISRATGFSPAKVSQLRSSIARKLEEHL